MERATRTIEEIRDRIRDLANIFLPDGMNPFVDVFVRVRARREMRELIDQATKSLGRNSPHQLIEWLFFSDGRMVRKVVSIYGKKAARSAG